MYVIKAMKKTTLIRSFIIVFFIVVLTVWLVLAPDDGLFVMATDDEPDNWESVIGGLFAQRDACVFNGNVEPLQKIFLTVERNGKWAYDNEAARSNYLAQWAARQGVAFQDIHTEIRIVRSKKVGRGYAFYLIASTEYTYTYLDDPNTPNSFRMGGYHSLDLIPGDTEGSWIISREWYDDPLAKSFNTKLYTAEMAEYISSHALADYSDLSEARLSAVRYADQYCGAASDGSNGYKYNPDYTDYNALGGNCANFASQVLYEGGGFKKNAIWNYKAGKGSRAWVNAQGFKDYLLYSGRGSQLARGKYADVYQAAFNLRPGDMIAYAYKGDVSHISVVTGQDSRGYPLVNSHNLDRYRVPWDIGWNTSAYSFYLIHVNY
jgi:hypothetical protein